MIDFDCTMVGSGGSHSDEYYDDGYCKWCGFEQPKMDHWTWWCNAWYHVGMFAWVDSWPT